MADKAIDTSVRGLFVGHTSEEGGMADVGVSLGLGGGDMLWVGEISNQLHAEAGEDAEAISSNGGHWIVLFRQNLPSIVIGKAISPYVGGDMLLAINAAMQAGKKP